MNSLNIKSIPPFLEKAVTDTLGVQLSMKAEVVAKSMSMDTIQCKSIDCLSTVGLDSSKLVGSVAIGFPKDTLLKIIEKMIGEVHAELTPENSDASGELMNIIFASARKNINESGFDFKPALPTTVIGKGLGLARSNLAGTLLFFDCKSEAGAFVVILSLRMKSPEESN